MDGDVGSGRLAIGIDGFAAESGDLISVEILADGERAATRDFTHAERPDLVSLRWLLSPRLIYTGRAILPDAVIRLLSPLYWRLATPATLRSDVKHLKEIVWHVELPAEVVARRRAQLTFVIVKGPDPRTGGLPHDERELGIHIRSLKFEQHDSQP
jgi:hypothetical protein